MYHFGLPQELSPDFGYSNRLNGQKLQHQEADWHNSKFTILCLDEIEN